MNPKAKAWLSGVVSFALVSLAFFLSARTINYGQAWVYLGVVAVSCIPLTRLIMNDPILVESRTKMGRAAEQRRTQKIIILFMVLPGIALFIVPGLDDRFGWSNVPLCVVVVGDLLMLLSMWMVYRVFKENSFGSATIEVSKDQKVITTGLTLSFATEYCSKVRWHLVPGIF